MIRIVTRLAPSQGAGSSTWGTLRVGMLVAPGIGVPAGFVADAVACALQELGGIPAKAVKRQHATRPFRKTNNAAARTSPTPIQIYWAVVGSFKVRNLLRKLDFISNTSLHGGWYG
jgi:hypothetical protein